MQDDIDLAYFKQRLEERLNVIVAGQEARKEESPLELDQTRVGRLSRMDAMQQQAMTQAAARLAVAEGNVFRPRSDVSIQVSMVFALFVTRKSVKAAYVSIPVC